MAYIFLKEKFSGKWQKFTISSYYYCSKTYRKMTSQKDDLLDCAFDKNTDVEDCWASDLTVDLISW